MSPFPILLAVLSGAGAAQSTSLAIKPLGPPSKTVTPATISEAALPKIPTVKATLTLYGGGGVVTIGSLTCRATDNELVKTCTGRVKKGVSFVVQRSSLAGVGFEGWGPPVPEFDMATLKNKSPCDGAGVCTVTTNDDIKLAARFSLADAQVLTVRLRKSPLGGGDSVAVTPSWASSSGFDPNGAFGVVNRYFVRTGQTVQIRIDRKKQGVSAADIAKALEAVAGGTATAPPPVPWGGDCAGTTGPVCTLTMTGPRSAWLE